MSGSGNDYERLLGIIFSEVNPLTAEPGEPLFYVGQLRKEGFSQNEIPPLIERLKSEGLVKKDSVVGDGEFDRVLEMDVDKLLKAVAKHS